MPEGTRDERRALMTELFSPGNQSKVAVPSPDLLRLEKRSGVAVSTAHTNDERLVGVRSYKCARHFNKEKYHLVIYLGWKSANRSNPNLMHKRPVASIEENHGIKRLRVEGS